MWIDEHDDEVNVEVRATSNNATNTKNGLLRRLARNWLLMKMLLRTRVSFST